MNEADLVTNPDRIESRLAGETAISNEELLTRRDFFKCGAVLAGSAIIFKTGLRKAIANSIATGLPLLTAANLNQRFAKARTAGTLRSLASDIKTSPIDWLRANYSITDAQSAGLRSIPGPHWAEVTRVLAFVENNRGASLSVTIHELLGSQSKKCSATIHVTSEAQVGTETLKAEAEARTT